MLLPILIIASGLLLVGLLYATRSSSLLDLSLFLTAGACLGAPLFSLNAGPIPLTVSRMLLFAIGLRCAWLATRGGIAWPQVTLLDTSWLVYLGFVTWSVASTDWGFRNRLPISIWLFFYLVPTLVYLIARTSRLEQNHLKIASLILMGFGAYLALTAICETQGISALIFPRYIASEAVEEFIGRGRGPWLNPVVNGIAQTACLVIAILWWPRVSVSARAGLSLYACLMLLGVFLTYTRSCWLGCLAACLVTIWLLASWRVRIVMMSWGMLGMALLGLSVIEASKSFKRDKYVSEAQMAESASLRPMLAAVAFDMFQDRPVYGVGLGQYKKWDDLYLTEETSELPLQKVGGYVQHNAFLASLVETGLLGCVGLIGFTAACVFTAYRLWNQRELAYSSRATGLALLGLTIAVVVNGLFHDILIIEGVKIWWLAFAGLTANLIQQASSRSAEFTPTQLLRRVPALPCLPASFASPSARATSLSESTGNFDAR